MTLDIYAEEIIDRFRNPHNFGAIESADFEAEEYNPLCGDRIKLQIKTHDGRLTAKFSGHGCAISQASADILCGEIKNKQISEIENLKDDDVTKLLNIPITGTRLKCALLGLWALRSALKNGS
ncbi:MAG: iron-sulfur cluster assembly scaffold protein [DPANN group archaeon]|nr:iron-sulfur cluster assembly scaffold protein [DPANN group archaeon]